MYKFNYTDFFTYLYQLFIFSARTVHSWRPHCPITSPVLSIFCGSIVQFLPPYSEIIKKKYNVELTYQNNSINDSTFKFDTCKRIQELPYLFFPDEMEKDIPVIKIIENSIEFSKNTDAPELLTYEELRVITQMTGDGITKAFRFPYMFI